MLLIGMVVVVVVVVVVGVCGCVCVCSWWLVRQQELTDTCKRLNSKVQ